MAISPQIHFMMNQRIWLLWAEPSYRSAPLNGYDPFILTTQDYAIGESAGEIAQDVNAMTVNIQGLTEAAGAVAADTHRIACGRTMLIADSGGTRWQV